MNPWALIINRAMSNFRAVFITTNSMESATTLANGLVENQLAACVNIIPGIKSVYRWEGKLNEDQEVLMMAKTRFDLIQQLTDWVLTHHPYSCPEVISIPIEGNPGYLEFIMTNTRSFN